VSSVQRHLLLFAIAGLLLSAAVVFRGGHTAPVVLDPQRVDVVAGSGLQVEVARLGAAVEPGSGVVDTARPAQALPTRSRRRAAFEQATDLYAFAGSLAPAVQAGDPEALWMMSRVYEYCADYAAAPADYASDTRAIADMQSRAAAARVAARERVSARCRRFVPADGLSYTAIVALTTEAAEAGDLAAEAALLAMGEPLRPEAEYRAGLVERVRESRDPEAFVALAPAMGVRASGDPALAGEVAGTQLTEVAWQVAACELGMDCSADSALMTAHCANGGICSREAGQDFTAFVFDAAVPKQGADVVDGMIKSLASGRKVSR
jgi:hypothetical protein